MNRIRIGAPIFCLKDKGAFFLKRYYIGADVVMTEDKWKVCALCRYLETVDNGLEIEEILDTEYTLFHCSRLNIFRQEAYLMAPVTDKVEDTRSNVCPYWEPWSKDCLGSEKRFLGLPEAENLLQIENSELAELFNSVFRDEEEQPASEEAREYPDKTEGGDKE